MRYTASRLPDEQRQEILAKRLYIKHYLFNDKGYAAAIAILLLAVTLVITAFNFSMQGKWVNYD